MSTEGTMLEPQIDESKNTELIEKCNIEGTPFECISTEEGHFGVYGSYRITEISGEKEEVISKLSEPKWDTMINVMCAIVDATNEFNKIKEIEIK